MQHVRNELVVSLQIQVTQVKKDDPVDHLRALAHQIDRPMMTFEQWPEVRATIGSLIISASGRWDKSGIIFGTSPSSGAASITRANCVAGSERATADSGVGYCAPSMMSPQCTNSARGFTSKPNSALVTSARSFVQDLYSGL